MDLKKYTDETEEVTEELEKRLEKIEKRKKKWQYAWAEDDMEYEDFKKRMAEAKEEETEIRSQLELLTVDVEENKEGISKEEINVALADIRDNWYLLKKDEKKSLVQSVVEKIHYEHRGNKLLITHIVFL